MLVDTEQSFPIQIGLMISVWCCTKHFFLIFQTEMVEFDVLIFCNFISRNYAVNLIFQIICVRLWLHQRKKFVFVFVFMLRPHMMFAFNHKLLTSHAMAIEQSHCCAGSVWMARAGANVTFPQQMMISVTVINKNATWKSFYFFRILIFFGFNFLLFLCFLLADILLASASCLRVHGYAYCAHSSAVCFN